MKKVQEIISSSVENREIQLEEIEISPQFGSSEIKIVAEQPSSVIRIRRISVTSIHSRPEAILSIL